MKSGLLAPLLLGLSLLSPPPLRGADRQGVVILSAAACCANRAWPKAEEMIRNELSLLGIPTAVVNARTLDEPEAGAELRRIALESRADAVMSVFFVPDEPTRVAIRIYDQVTEKTTYKTWPVDPQNDPDAAIVTGLRAVDTLRASLLETRMAKQTPEPRRRPAEVGKLAETTTLETDRVRQIVIGAGGAMGGTPKGGVFLAGFEATLGWHPLSHGGVALSVLYLGLGPDISKGGVTSSVDLLSVRGWLVWRILDTGRFRPALALGGGSLIVFAKGLRGDDMNLVDTRTRVGYGAVSASLAVSITSRLFVRLGLSAGLSFPEIRLRHATVLAATLGRPLLDGALSLGVRLP
jgi:hypothetical protein